VRASSFPPPLACSVYPLLRLKRFSTALVFVALVHAAPAMAQGDEPDMTKVRVKLGPLALNPTIELTNLGVDTNVFNEPAGQEQRDFTFTLSPRTDLWLRMGRTWLTGNIREDIVWYQKFSSERSANEYYTVGWLVPLNRLRFNVTTTYLNARDRPGYEIDARSQRSDLTFKGTVEVRALSKTFIGVGAQQERLSFDSLATFDGVNLHDALNHATTTGTVSIRHQLTPLTSITLDAGRTEDRFAYSPFRNSNSTQASLGVQFDQSALIKGSARFGYRDFVPVSADVPAYRGSTAAVELSYVALGTTKLAVQATRDIQYSFELTEPYYLITGVTGTVTQQVFGPVDAVARGGLQHLNYRDLATAGVESTNRTDRVTSYGGGVGYHVGQDLRIGVNVDHQARRSDVVGRSYKGLKLGTSVTYGF
jgi:hypothetical protein